MARFANTQKIGSRIIVDFNKQEKQTKNHPRPVSHCGTSKSEKEKTYSQFTPKNPPSTSIPSKSFSGTKNATLNDSKITDKSLNAALGSIFGAFIGDALGSVLEFRESVTTNDVKHALAMNQRGYFNNGPGQVTDDSELAMCQLNGLLRMEKGKFDPNKIAFFYKEWIKSQPFDIGITTRKAFSKLLKVDDHEWLAATVQDFVEASKFGSLSNGSLMRATPLAVYCRNLNDFQMREVVRQDVSMTHSDIIIKDAVLLYVMCISKIINDPDNLDIALEYVRHYANLHVFSQAREWLEISVHDLEKVGAEKNIGFARIGFHHAFREFKKVLDGPRFNGDTFPHAISNILTLGGDTDTNAAIVGGLIGACVGYNNLPVDWKRKVEGIYDQVSWIQRPDFLDQRKVKENVIQLFNKTD